MADIGKHGAMSDAIAAETVCDEVSRFVPQPLQQSLEETLGSHAISSLLHQNVEHDAMLARSPPQIMENTADADERLIHVPRIFRPWPAPLEPPGKVAAELCAPEPNALVGHDDAALGEDQFDVTQAQAEHVIQPYCVAYDFRCKAMPGKGDELRGIPPALPVSHPSASRGNAKLPPRHGFRPNRNR
jgi:hypothetical protein